MGARARRGMAEAEAGSAMHLMHVWILWQNIRLAVGHRQPWVRWRQVTDTEPQPRFAGRIE